MRLGVLESEMQRRRRVMLLSISMPLFGLLAFACWQAFSREKLGTFQFPSRTGVVTVYSEHRLLWETGITFEVSGDSKPDLRPERLTSYDGFRSFRDDYEDGRWVGPSELVFSRRHGTPRNSNSAELVVSNASGRPIRVVRVHSRDLVLVFDLAKNETRTVTVNIPLPVSLLWVEASGRFEDGGELTTSGSDLTIRHRSRTDTYRIRLTIGPESVEFTQD